ncbi:MAG TPA: hypothetical protein VN643_17760 [Pyrinomonadaceae bacterium]|nr:hypothetical protein [Pyrinomonadaceae bacterium]
MNRRFVIAGFLIGLAAFLAANVYSYSQAFPPCCDLTVAFGLPFPLGRFGGLVGQVSFFFTGILIDSLIAMFASLALGWLFSKALPFVFTSMRNVKLWHLGTRL